MAKAGACGVGKWFVAWTLGAVCALAPVAGMARGPLAGETQASISVAQLPTQGQETYALIHQGGPFPFDKDGTVFGNRERQLPPHKRGYYREYTVRTPGASHRGARRIVCGGNRPQTPDACYYTSDHYASFREISE